LPKFGLQTDFDLFTLVTFANLKPEIDSQHCGCHLKEILWRCNSAVGVLPMQNDMPMMMGGQNQNQKS